MQLPESVFQNNHIDANCRFFFELAVRNNREHILVCSTEHDRKQWLRAFQLIIQMNDMLIDFGKVNIFAFEKHFNLQYELIHQKCADQAQGHSNPTTDAIGNISRLNDQAVSNEQLGAPQDAVQVLKHKIGLSQSSTFTSSFKCIEGYLSKEIQNKSILQPC